MRLNKIGLIIVPLETCEIPKDLQMSEHNPTALNNVNFLQIDMLVWYSHFYVHISGSDETSSSNLKSDCIWEGSKTLYKTSINYS